jgi:hypothetical protein
MITGAGFVDAWAEKRPHEDGFTCCQDPALRNPESQLSERVDLVFWRGPKQHGNAGIVGGVHVTRVGVDPAKRINGLWPSDHAGVVATFRLPPGK